MAPTGPKMSVDELKDMAKKLRRHIVAMLTEAGSGHPGGSLSLTDLVTALYFRVMTHDVARPDWPDRDRFVLSKGHGVPAQYAALAEAGYIDPALLATLRKLGSPLQGHPARKELPLLEASTGSLGQGLSVAAGIALAGKLDGAAYRTYVIIGDGEAQEGQIWEAALFAAQHKLDNLTLIVDCNGFQLDGPTADILSLAPLADKLRAFGFETSEIDGHDMAAIVEALEATKEVTGKPQAIVAHTIKGKGVSFMENDNEFHGKAPTPEQCEQALAELA
ncbi:MAG: transketolase [Armatimonadetes bacterium CG_4_10_14_0_8_um_filter_66_14]|nr:transketolase [Armatimonadota bacterium]OIP05310.1 MAG: transketolase [Armatimonadetes bacterium CG2_30_66_41]PIZ35278.1 MAG: transketolase [Armatimonadetes bacterium CG_4_10_14_0_8_um_filter_66_14]